MILLDDGYIRDGQYYFYFKDHLGNIAAVMNSNADMLQYNFYHPYGKRIASLGGGSINEQPFKYG